MGAADQGASATSGSLRLFISYSHKDDDLRAQFVVALSQLQREGLLESWDDREITGGTEWAGQIDSRLNAADIIVLLVSPDFLASPYCYDREMTRALERHEKREARVVPIILRPCDWKTSPFAKLNALPKEGKPVVDWRTLDHAFLNVAQGLRSIAGELRRRSNEDRGKPRRGERTGPRRLLKPGVLAIIGLALLGMGCWFWYFEHQRNSQTGTYIARGNDLLNVGRYEDARKSFGEAVGIDPANAQATLGIKIADLAGSRSDAVAFQQRLSEMLKLSPNESHLRVLNGDNLLAQGRRREAALEYEKAAEMNPRLAEAYFRLGVIYDKEGKIGHSLPMYVKSGRTLSLFCSVSK